MNVESQHEVTFGILDAAKLCGNCNATTKEPYIFCYQCKKNSPASVICMMCFSKGAEFGHHRSDHEYIVIRTDISLWDGGWSAQEELGLLSAILECGFGNWQEVSHRMPGKTPQDCESHYQIYYVEKPADKLLPKFSYHENENISYTQPVKCYPGLEDPVRPLIGTIQCRDMAGYNAARGDFDIEYDHGAETDVMDLDYNLFNPDPEDVFEENEPEDLEIGRELQIALLDMYRRRMGQRYQLKRIIREHGLLASTRCTMALGRYRPYLSQGFQDCLPRLFQLLSSHQLDLLLEGLKHQAELKRQVSSLMEYRMNGIRKQSSVMTYEAMKKRREGNIKNRRNLVVAQGVDGTLEADKLSTTLGATIPCTSRRISIPLNIVGKPGYENLKDTERKLSSEIRLLPEDYLRFKSIIVDECRKSNGLRLAQARTLIKIDVNKIRKIYDYLLVEGLVYARKK